MNFMSNLILQTGDIMKKTVSFLFLLLFIPAYGFPSDTARLMADGKAAFEAKNYSEAVKCFDKVITADPKNPEISKIYASRGLAKEGLGDHRGAIGDFDTAIKLDPKMAGSYAGRGMVKNNTGDYSGAIEDFDSALKIDPKLIMAYFNRGISRYKSGDYKGTINDLDKTIELDPDISIVYFYRGVTRGKLGDKDKAMDDLKKAADMGYKPASDLIGKIEGK
jgi:tetratricopeptide (TPR) repeat protein